MDIERRQNRITTGFILLSLLLHLLLLLVPKDRLLPTEIPPPPVYVEVRPPQPLDRELDLPIREELEKPREEPAKRLAEKDQVVETERAPEGQDTEDREKVVRAAPRPAPKTPPPAPAKPEPKPKTAPQPEPREPLPATPEGWRQREIEPKPNLPDLQTLTQISPETLAQIESDWRRKYRADIERGDTVWMDTQQDLLISFMRRFRDNIYGVWNYPDAAARRDQQGTCLVRITVDRSGNVTDVILLESSGYRVLDEEAMRAVREGASYGPLPRAYPHEDLKIMAFFQYRMSGVKRTYRPRPGSIY
jgi:periplasmic protein TonB